MSVQTSCGDKPQCRKLSLERSAVLAFVLGALRALPAAADPVGVEHPEVQVTATRLPSPADLLPASVTIISGVDLRARGANSLRSALALVAGVDAPPGGDAGPSSSVPSLWGLHEFDAFLLVVDGVPWGGAFNPALPILDLNDVERIEVLKGPAPVMYGATSFVGVIQVVRYAAGSSSDELRLAVRGREGGAVDLAMVLPNVGDYKQSMVLGADRNRFTGRDQGANRGHFLYRGAAPLAAGMATVDAEYTTQTQLPTSPEVRTATGLSTLSPLDANLNPSDAAIIEHRARLTLGYSRPFGGGEWDTRLSYTRSSVHDVRGFVRPELAIGDDGNNADGFNQVRTIDDLWFDSFVALPLARGVDLTTGVDWLYGRGVQQSYNFAYVAALDGSSVAAPSSTYHVDEVNGLHNTRNFGGLYTQLNWAPTDAITVLAGLRLNHTQEQQDSGHIDTIDSSASFAGSDSRAATRLSGSAGVTVRMWGNRAEGEDGRFFVDYRNTFKPAAIDFGPDVNVAILTPEQASGFEAGLRGHALRGQLEWEIAAFSLDFANLVVHTVDALGDPILANAGTERFKGIEAELQWHLNDELLLNGAFSYHDARFGYAQEAEGGVLTELKGHQLDMSPHDMGSIGLLYAPAAGLQASVQVAYIGRRFLDRLNTTAVGGYATADASLGYRTGQYTFSLTARNLTDRRAPVSGSEFGEQSFYLLPARQLEAAFTVHLR